VTAHARYHSIFKSGSVWQGRFRRPIQADDSLFLFCVRRTHPLRANMVWSASRQGWFQFAATTLAGLDGLLCRGPIAEACRSGRFVNGAPNAAGTQAWSCLRGAPFGIRHGSSSTAIQLGWSLARHRGRPEAEKARTSFCVHFVLQSTRYGTLHCRCYWLMVPIFVCFGDGSAKQRWLSDCRGNHSEWKVFASGRRGSGDFFFLC